MYFSWIIFLLLTANADWVAELHPTPTAQSPIKNGGDSSPAPLHQEEPEYTAEALGAGIQGTVSLTCVVDEQGLVSDVKVVSPLGFGLDEAAARALRKWVFRPGTKGGVAVKSTARVEINFRLPMHGDLDKTEGQRTRFNVALAVLKSTSSTPSGTESAVKAMQRLNREKYAPAMYLNGLWKIKGEYGPRDVPGGIGLLKKAADKRFGPAVYELAVRRLEGRDLRADAAKGLEEMRLASALGYWQAQYYMGEVCERGDKVAKSMDEAQRHFRLCAAQGQPTCQYRLGRLLLDATGRSEAQYLEAVALLQDAAAKSHIEARQVAAEETSKLTAGQAARVAEIREGMLKK